jgi:outer membrane protein OmpA-like peptidoglycan-associated protein
MPNTVKHVWRRFKQGPTLLRVSGYLSLVYLSYLLILGVAIPHWIESKGSAQLSDLLQRDVAIGQVTINPFLLKAELTDLVIKEHDNSTNFLHIPSISLDINGLQSIKTLTPTFDYLYLNQPSIHITKLTNQDGLTRFNFSDIADQFTTAEEPNNLTDGQTPTTVTANEPAAITRLIVQDIHIQEADVTYQDNATSTELHYRPITLSLNHFDSHAVLTSTNDVNAETSDVALNHFSITITGSDGSNLKSDLQFQLVPLKIDGQLTVNKVTLRPFSGLINQHISAKLTSGEINASTQFQLTETDQGLIVNTHSGQLILNQLIFNQGNQPKAKIARLKASEIVINSEKQRLQIGDVAVKGLWSELAIKNNTVDLAALFTPKSPNPSTATNRSVNTNNTTPATKAQDLNWLVKLNKFNLTDSEINLIEHQVANGHHWRLYPLSISTGALDSHLTQPINYKVAFHIGSSATKLPTVERGELSSEGSYHPSNHLVKGSILLEKFDIRQLQAYLSPYLNIQLSSGELATAGRFSILPSGNSTFNGTLHLDKVKIKDNVKHQTILKWQELGIDKLNFDLDSNKLNIASITLNQPYTKIVIAKDRTTNIGDLMVSSTTQIPPTVSQTDASRKNSNGPTRPSFSVDVGAIKLTQGSAYFADNSLTPNFASGIESLEGQIQSLSSKAGTKALVDIKGKIDQYAPITLKGEINPLLDTPYLDLNLAFSNVELTSVSPYAGTYAGYYIDKGQLSSTLNYRLENNKLNGDNHLIFNQLTLGKKSNSAQATNLPLKLAIALLQDRHGVIDLGLHVSGDLNNPNFNLGGIVITALGNLINKAVTAPFSFLAGLIGSDEQFDQITFNNGMAKLNPDQERVLKQLAEALKDRPQLTISVSGAVNVAEDSHTLAELKLQQQLLDQSQLDALPVDLSASRLPASGPLADALVFLFEQQVGRTINDEIEKVRTQLSSQSAGSALTQEQIVTELHIGMYNQLINKQPVSRNELENLAQSRAQAIKAYLVNQSNITRDRVFILDSKSQLNTQSATAELKVSAN